VKLIPYRPREKLFNPISLKKSENKKEGKAAPPTKTKQLRPSPYFLCTQHLSLSLPVYPKTLFI
jgi:hypothetical protein